MKLGRIAALVVVLLLLASPLAWIAYDRLFREVIPAYEELAEQFKYGAIGNLGATGLPLRIWSVLPELCPKALPRPGGYEVFGFHLEDGREVPVGIARGRIGFERVAINCAACHTASVRFAGDERPRLYPGGASATLDIQRYQRFLSDCAEDPAFAPEPLLALIGERYEIDWIDRLLLRFLIVPRTREALVQRGRDFAWTRDRPDWGPGRIDPFNPVKFGMLGLPVDGTIGNSDMQPAWGLDRREALRPGAPLHWDGLNSSIREVVVSSALGDEAVAGELDWAVVDRIEAFVRRTQAPGFPLPLDAALVARGAAVFAERCAACHGESGERVLTVIPVEEVGTDPHRLEMWSDAARDAYLAYDQGYDWGFAAFRNVEGYVAEPHDGVWLRAPYLHNGSVPTLEALLAPPAERPAAFVRGLDLYEPERGGFAAPACEPGAHQGPGFCYDTREPGNASAGHLYGTDLAEADKRALVAYLLSL